MHALRDSRSTIDARGRPDVHRPSSIVHRVVESSFDRRLATVRARVDNGDGSRGARDENDENDARGRGEEERKESDDAGARGNDDETDDDSPCCRFCFEGANDAVPGLELIAPCACRGGQRFIHADCLLRWQRMCVVQSPTHPAYWSEDTRSNVCNVCKTTFTTPPPSRLTLMSSFTGAEIAAMLSNDFLLVSHDAFSRTLREKLEQMPPGLRRICGYEHWVDGTYLITEVIESEEDEREGGEGGERGVGDDSIVAVNLNGRTDLNEVVNGESRLFELVEDVRRGATMGRFNLEYSITGEGAVISAQVEDEDEERYEPSSQSEEEAEAEENAEGTEEEPSENDEEEDEEGDDEDDEGNENENGEEEDGAGRNRVRLVGNDAVRELLSPLGAVFSVYQRFRRRRAIDAAFEEVALEREVDVDEVKSKVEVECFTGGPVDEDNVSLCLVVGGDNERGFVKIEDGVSSAISVAFRQRVDGCETFPPGTVVKTTDDAGREVMGVVTRKSGDDEWSVATALGVVRRAEKDVYVLNASTRGKVLVFWGTAQWSRAQLLGEIARGHWGLTKMEPVDVARADDAYRRATAAGLAFAPLTEMTETFMREAISDMNRIRSTGQIARAASPAPR